MEGRPALLRRSSKFVKDDQEEVEELLRSLSGVTEEEVPPRVYRKEFRRPQSFREKLFQELAETYSKLLGKRVSPRAIEYCVEQMSAVEKRLKEDEAAGDS